MGGLFFKLSQQVDQPGLPGPRIRLPFGDLLRSVLQNFTEFVVAQVSPLLLRLRSLACLIDRPWVFV